jgi:hypothetical protein
MQNGGVINKSRRDTEQLIYKFSQRTVSIEDAWEGGIGVGRVIE